MQIAMLGPFEVRADDGSAVEVPGTRLRGLLVALALHAGQGVSKTSLVDWIWGEHPPVDATNALQRLVSRLRRVLPGGAIEGRVGGYVLRVERDAVDVVRFERLVRQARTTDGPRRIRLLREALGLWRGAALQDVGLKESPAFDAAVMRLEELRLTIAEERFDAEVTRGRGADVVSELTDLVAAHPVREKLVGALMRALVAAGRDSQALLVYQRAREALADALGVDPSPELAALHSALLRGESGRHTEHRRTNLRAELTSYIGKAEDVTAVRELVADHRLTTLIGPGGSGKTRLATETARTLIEDFADGAWVVELAVTGAEEDLAQPTLSAIGLRDALLGKTPNTEPADLLIAAIREREALLVLDNCEHVVEAAAAFAHRVLGDCRRLRILATSREPLGITGEALWVVEPLGLPAPDAGPGGIEASPAVQLLRDRAGAVRTAHTVGPRTWETMARVCRALDGMPLAIELAAARLRSMPIDQLANRLDDRFRLLTGGSRTALPRHQTLRAAVDWSWELLTDAERAALRRLSVFSGGVSLEAAERVCGRDSVIQDGVLELVSSLTEKSLLTAQYDGALRYRMTGTIKEYARHRLAESGETEAVRRAHLAHFTEFTEAAEPHLRRAEQLEWLAALEVEHDNIVAAMRGALAAGEAHAAMRLAAGAGWYWWLSGRKAEGVELIMAATRVPGEVPDETRAMVYALVVLFLSSGRGDEREAEEWIRKAHRCSQGDPRRRHPLLGLVAPLERMLQAPDAFLPAFESLLEDGDPWVRALARLHLGKMRIMFGHDGRDADAYLEKALAEFRLLGERFGISFAMAELADRIAVRGEFAGACAHYEEAVSFVSEVGAIEDVIRMRSRQAQLYWLLGDGESSAVSIAEAERQAQQVTWPHALAELALAKAELARWSGDREEARRNLRTATSVLGEDAGRPAIRAVTHDLLGYLADDLGAARTHRAEACEAASEDGHAPLIAQVLIGAADLALRCEQVEQAVRLLGASASVRGLPDRSHPDANRIEQTGRHHLGDAGFSRAFRDGARGEWTGLVAGTLAS